MHVEINFGRFDLTRPLTPAKALKLVEDRSLNVIQTRDYIPDPTTIHILNDIILPQRPDIAFRVYGHDTVWSQIPFLDQLSNLENLQWEVRAIKSLAPVVNLKKLSSLSLGDGQVNPKISLKPLLAMKDRLTHLCISGDFKDQDALIELKKLKSLTLLSTKIDFLEELKNLPLEYFGTCGSRIPDLTPIQNFKRLKTIWIKNHKTIENIDFIMGLENLEWIDIEYLSCLTRFPDCSKMKNLKRILILTCNKLVDIEHLKSLTHCRVQAWGKNLPGERYEH